MFNLFKRVRPTKEPARLAQSAANDPNKLTDKPAIDDRAPQTERKLTPASWPVSARKPQAMLWGGGCCG